MSRILIDCEQTPCWGLNLGRLPTIQPTYQHKISNLALRPWTKSCKNISNCLNSTQYLGIMFKKHLTSTVDTVGNLYTHNLLQTYKGSYGWMLIYLGQHIVYILPLKSYSHYCFALKRVVYSQVLVHTLIEIWISFSFMYLKVLFFFGL